MIIKCTKKALTTNLYIGLGWTVFALAFVIFNPDNMWFHMGYAGIGLAFLLLHFHMKKWQYGVLTTDYVKQNSAFQKKLPISEVIQIKEFAGDVIFKSAKREVTFDTKLIEQQSLAEFKALISKIKAENPHIK